VASDPDEILAFGSRVHAGYDDPKAESILIFVLSDSYTKNEISAIHLESVIESFQRDLERR